jgi:circadian clock protein KaiC
MIGARLRSFCPKPDKEGPVSATGHTSRGRRGYLSAVVRPGKSKTAQPLPKLATGIAGFDAMSRGGLPRHRCSLLIGGPGAGKTVFALQCLVGAARRGAPGIFVAFEENPAQIVANGATFDWGMAELSEEKLFFLDAHLSPTLVKAGDFDLTAMLAMLAAKKKEIGAEWIVFDGIDVLLTVLQDPAAEMREIYRLRDWLSANQLTAILTAKLDGGTAQAMHYDFLQFMVDCVVRFDRRQEARIAVQSVQITKYRGSGFAASEFPLSFGPSGVAVGAAAGAEMRHEASTDRVTAGFQRLDVMLGGGVFRGSSTLITGAPGTSKTTLSCKFAEAACRRGERTLFVSYDEAADQITRNLSSVGIQLKPHLKSGLLRMYSARVDGVSAEEQLGRLAELVREHRPQCMVIDPLTAIAKAGALDTARTVASRLIYLVKDAGITLFVTALSGVEDASAESTEVQISTIADTWIHLSYVVRGGERNRALTIVKSRGTSHSNQVRELVLDKSGPTLTDVYSAGGEVLMGTLRWEKEIEENAKLVRQRAEFDYKQRELQFAEANTSAQIKALQMELEKQRAELALYSGQGKARSVSLQKHDDELRRRRSADAAGNGAPKSGNGVPR